MSLKQRLQEIEQRLAPPPITDDSNGPVHPNAPICVEWNRLFRFTWRLSEPRTQSHETPVRRNPATGASAVAPHAASRGTTESQVLRQATSDYFRSQEPKQ